MITGLERAEKVVEFGIGLDICYAMGGSLTDWVKVWVFKVRDV